MIKLRYLFLLSVFSLFTFALFQIKFKVQELHIEAAELKKELQHEKDSIYILKAEWTYLNQPDRLHRLTQKFLDLKELKTNQLASSQDNLMITAKSNYAQEIIPDSSIVKISYNAPKSQKKIKKLGKVKKWNYRKRPVIKSRPKK